MVVGTIFVGKKFFSRIATSEHVIVSCKMSKLFFAAKNEKKKKYDWESSLSGYDLVDGGTELLPPKPPFQMRQIKRFEICFK